MTLQKLKPLAAAVFLVILAASSYAQAAAGQVSVQTQVLQGNEFIRQGLFYDAIQQFQAALRRNPQYAEAYRGMAEAYFALNEFDESLVHVDRAISLDPQNLSLKNFRGRILLALGDVEQAGTIFSQILTIQPYNREALLGQAELLTSTGNLSEAQQELLNTVSIHPRDRKALLSLAIVYQEQGNLRSAEQYIQRALDYYSENPIVQTVAGRFYLESGRYPLAGQHLDLALERDPQNLEALFLQASLAIRTGRYADALRPLQTALQIQPESDLYWYTRGLALYHLQRDEEAVVSLRRALAANPENEIARIFLESILVETMEFNDPLRTQLADYRLGQARQFELQNRFDRALVYLDRGLSLSPTHEALRRARADLYLKSQRIARYVEELSFLLEDLEVQDQALEDQLEVYRHLQLDSVSRDWELDQFAVSPEFQVISLFTMEQASRHPEAVQAVAQQTAEVLLGRARFTLNPEPLLQGRYRSPQPVTSVEEAFSQARAGGSDFFLVLTTAEIERQIDIRADLYLSRTGRLLTSFRISRTGNHRVMESVIRLVQEIDGAIPQRGRIVDRELDSALINLGSEHGIVPGAVLQVLNPRDVLLAPDGTRYQVDSTRIIGSFEVEEVDALISSGKLQPTSFFDSISLGDTVVPEQSTQQSAQDAAQGSKFPSIYFRIRGLR